MTTTALFKSIPLSLEETGFAINDGVLIAGKIYIVRGFYAAYKNDFLLVENEDGQKFKAFLNTCQRIDGVLL